MTHRTQLWCRAAPAPGIIHFMVECSSRLPLALKLQRRSTFAGCFVNTLSVTMLVVYMTVVFPPAPEATILTREASLILVAVYTLIGGLTFYRRAQPEFGRMRRWMAEGRPPTADERVAVMRLPVLFARMTLVRWLLAVPVFAVPNLFASREFALEEAVTTLLAGLSTSAAVYLTSEWLLRPAFALALDRSAPPEARSLGIGPRLLLTWVLCSGVPILMVALIPVGREVTDPKELIAPIWFAAGAAMGAGFIATKLATQSVARPVRELRRAIDAVTEGDLDVSVPVDDGSEVGRLQAGFNGMVEGLREREQLRDLYGRQVGIDVAREALERGGALGGETRDVSALFVDVVGSTGSPTARARSGWWRCSTSSSTSSSPRPRSRRAREQVRGRRRAVRVRRAGRPGRPRGARARLRARAARPHRRARRRARRRDRRVVRHRGGRPRRRRDALRVHGGRRPGQRGGAAHRARQAARRAAAGQRRHRRAAGGDEAARWTIDGEVTLRGRECPTRIACPVGVREPVPSAHGAA